MSTIYTWINYAHAIEELPLLKFKTKRPMGVHIKKIEKEGFIKVYREKDNTIYIRLLDKIDEISPE